MEIKTITCHRVYNYGASLQAFALQHYLERQGHSVEIIDFWPHFFHNRYNLFYVSPKSRYFPLLRKFPFLRPFYCLIRNKGIFKTYGRKIAFDKFEKKYLHITKESYPTSDSLKQVPPSADVYIAGSDQIWNTDMPNGHEQAFYLDFGKKEIRRIAYAGSFGVSSIPDACKEFISKELHQIDFISVREASGLKILSELGFGTAVQVLDPVFLLSANEWHQALSYDVKSYRFMDDKYILIYDFIGDDRIKQFAIKSSRDLKCKLVSVNDFRAYKYVDYNVNQAGPCEFLSLIEHSSMVITNSFHATAFSVIFGKEFYTFNLLGQNNSSRMTDFLSMIGLIERFNAKQIKQTIDHEKVKDSLAKEIKRSRSFLQHAIEK